MTLIVAGGRLLVEDDGGAHRLSPPVDIHVRDGVIASIAPHNSARPVAGDAVSVDGMLVAPGLVNGHTHSHEILHKGRYENLPLEVWMHYVRPPFVTAPLTAEEIYLRTLLSAIEMLRGGATTVVDDVNHFPLLRGDHIDAVFRAYDDAGVRALVSVSLFDQPFFRALPFIEDEMTPDMLARLSAGAVPARDTLLRLAAELLARRPPGRGRVGFIVAPSAPQRCTDGFLAALLGLAHQENAPAIIHVHETRLQAVTACLAYGKTMIAHLDDLGLLGPRLSVIHGVWLTPDDVTRLARTGTTLQHNPVSNLMLGSGLAPVRALLRSGVNISLGSDGCGSCTSANMLSVVGAAAMVHSLRGADPEDWISAREAWRMGTVNGARALGLNTGRVESGYCADLVCYRLDGAAYTPLNDPLRQLVFGERGQGIDTVIVDGRVVMRGGRVRTVNEADVFARVRELHARLWPEIVRCEGLVGELRPVYERIYRRCLAVEIPVETYAARF
jgi:5-methylthioadenosine/S-adenosylhomocysteine deaminase